MPVTVSQIMQEPVIVQQDDSLQDVARTMLERQASCAAVVDPDGKLVGVIADDEFNLKDRQFPFSTEKGRQLFGEWVSIERVEQEYASAGGRRARDVMAAAGSVVGEETRLSVVLPLLQHGRNVAVVRDGRPVGMLTRHDLLKLVGGGAAG
jgi:predicted transcriptional regulator